MSTILGFSFSPALAGIENPNLAGELSAFDPAEIIGWPPHESITSTPGFAPPVKHFPVEANGKPIAGASARCYVDDFYHRVHVFPPRLDLGNVVSTLTERVYLWNAWFLPQTLTAIDGLSEGVTITPVDGAPPPDVYAALQERALDVTVSPLGASRIDDAIIFSWQGLPDVALIISGIRVIAWVFPPNWATPVEERLEWLTDVLTSRSGAEQRRALRIAPRRFFEAEFIAAGDARRLLDLMLLDWSGNEWSLPIWPDIQFLPTPLPAGETFIPAATAHRDFVAGGMALLIAADDILAQTEACEIVSVEPDGLTLKRATGEHWPAGTRLYPARVARLSALPELTRKTDQAVVFSAAFSVTEPCDWAADAGIETYRGYPVLTLAPNEREDLQTTVSRLLTVLESPFGRVTVTDSAKIGFPGQSHRWLLSGQAEADAFRRLAYFLRGRQQAVWLPTFADDLALAAPSSLYALTVKRCGYARYGVGRLGRQDIRIRLADGQVFYRRVTAADESQTDGTENLALDPPLPRALLPEEIERIDYLALMRGSDDTVTLRHLTDSEGVAESEIVFRGVKDAV
ncbi:MAG: hypothetical protein LBQ81_12165 [Zoogloeaceae bacterium]|jgi:hypothetical protein|nr:hypothetical protein [Zoogloeaceae bacterium]